MACEEAALAYLNQNKLLFMNMLEVLRRGSAEVLYAGADGVLLYDRLVEGHLLAADSPAALERILPLMAGCRILIGHQLWCKDALAARFGFREEQICHQAAWLDAEPPALPEFGGELRFLDSAWAPWVYRQYSHAFGGEAYIEAAIDRGMLGAFVDGECAGFVGFHIEGAIGMLEVLPPYRRRGLGEVLLLGAVRMAMERGQYPFAQVIAGNAPSLALHRKAGLALSRDLLFWLF